jgi:hypothetical protein
MSFACCERPMLRQGQVAPDVASPLIPSAHPNWGSCKGDWSRSMKTTKARWRYECIPNSRTGPFAVATILKGDGERLSFSVARRPPF